MSPVWGRKHRHSEMHRCQEMPERDAEQQAEKKRSSKMQTHIRKKHGQRPRDINRDGDTEKERRGERWSRLVEENNVKAFAG